MTIKQHLFRIMVVMIICIVTITPTVYILFLPQYDDRWWSWPALQIFFVLAGNIPLYLFSQSSKPNIPIFQYSIIPIKL